MACAETGTAAWPAALDVARLQAQGWQATPFRQFILKMHSRCNLACDYCYVYEMADQSWRSQPLVMNPDTIRQTGARIAEHVQAHGLSDVHLMLHGGEPLLAGADRLEFAVNTIRRAVGDAAEVAVGVQTNGTRLNRDMLEMFARLGVRVSVSLDGDQRANDRHRRYPSGRGSHTDVLHALRLLNLPAYRDLFAGLLCTIDLDNDPVQTYETLLAFHPPSMDFLLPDGNWSTPPPRRSEASTAAPYADWLTAVFDRWYSAPRRETDLRFFSEILNLVLGGGSVVESVGLSPVSLIVIETDGSIEQVDVLKSAYAGAPETGLDVFQHSFDMALTHPSIVARQLGWGALSDTCRQCTIATICGGGLYPHRYRSGSGFRNPSVYCPDLFSLIRHIRDRVAADLRRLTTGTNQA